MTSALTLSALGLGASAASAEEDEKIDVKGGYAFFENSPSDIGREFLWVGDERRDGYAVRGYLDWRDSTGRHTFSVTASGDDETEYRDVYLKEGTRVTLSVCYVDNGHVKQCSLGQVGYA